MIDWIEDPGECATCAHYEPEKYSHPVAYSDVCGACLLRGVDVWACDSCDGWERFIETKGR